VWRTGAPQGARAPEVLPRIIIGSPRVNMAIRFLQYERKMKIEKTEKE
jgi:hypothetical protein